jgi:hypothetical protein
MTDNLQSFSSSGSLHCSDPASISLTPCKLLVAAWYFPQDPCRTVALHDACAPYA